MDTRKLPLRIVIGLSGWVWIGRVERVADEWHVHHSRCIRLWGKPLAELANDGPTSETVLEAELLGVKRLHVCAVISQEDCQEKAWK